MADQNAYYTSVDQTKNVLGISDEATDAYLQEIIELMSRRVDSYCRQRFYTPTLDETRYFDLPAGNELWFDYPLVSLTTLTNGDGTSITSAYYVLAPANKTPKYKLILRPSRGAVFQTDSYGNTEQVIAATGKWGYSSAPPQEVVLTVLQLLSAMWVRRGTPGIASKRIGEYEVKFAQGSEVQQILLTSIPGELVRHVL